MADLIIEIPYAGLGDHLFHSHLPRIAKQFGNYEKVYVSSLSESWNVDCMRVVWELNPYVDGIVEVEGVSCDLKSIVDKIEKKIKNNEFEHPNLLDEVMFAFGLDDGKRFHEPELYYKPKYVERFNKAIFDPNFISWVGQIEKADMMRFLKKERIKLDAIMMIRSEKALFIPKGNENFIETKTLSDFCDLIFSASELFCLTSGTATLAASLNKPATVFYGDGQGAGFRHSKLHTYKKVNRTFANSIKFSLKSTLNLLKSK